MESVVIVPRFWRDRRVLVTGHTGFKGAWATMVLRSLGANVFGLALPPEETDGLFIVAGVENDIRHRIGDLRDLSSATSAVADAAPEIIIHMAAQSLVLRSYAEPVATYATNVMGTVHILEAARNVESVRAIVIVTSDKCYENVGIAHGYRESDPLGGHDPYSNSKGCAELVTSAYRRSFFKSEPAARVATARAGNVIGGGDWAKDRLIPDAMRAFMAGLPLCIRNDSAIRPWQHVLDPVIAYLVLAERLFAGREADEAWNFGPSAESEVPVSEIANRIVRLWGSGVRWQKDGGQYPHEATYLRLDCSKAAERLSWSSLLDLESALRLTVDWYRAFERRDDMRAITQAQIDGVLNKASARSAHHSTLVAIEKTDPIRPSRDVEVAREQQ